eukprot:scaffold197_cov268-Chaetoceros_neogracile.AAC.62
MTSTKVKQIILCLGNAAIHVSWLRVLWTLVFEPIGNEETCNVFIRPQTLTALLVSVRAGVEIFLAPKLPCNAPEHLWTVACWALDGFFRFGIFGADAFLSLCGFESPSLLKTVRYTVGPLLFPLGAGGEMFMVIRAAKDGRPFLYLAAGLWPVFFYPLMKQLLKQRAKHFIKLKEGEMKKNK